MGIRKLKYRDPDHFYLLVNDMGSHIYLQLVGASAWRQQCLVAGPERKRLTIKQVLTEERG